MSFSPDGDQLLLDLGDAALGLSLPWGGRSPRGLTRVALEGIFKAQAAKSVSEFDCVQLEMFKRLAPKTTRRPYRGSPLLIPLGKVDKGVRYG